MLYAKHCVKIKFSEARKYLKRARVPLKANAASVEKAKAEADEFAGIFTKAAEKRRREAEEKEEMLLKHRRLLKEICA